MKSFALATLTALTVALPIFSTAASATDAVDRRQYWQQHRIQEARRSGELTRREYLALEAEQARIAAFERRAKSDGYLSHSERERLRQLQNDASRHIYQESHDGQRSWYRRFY